MSWKSAIRSMPIVGDLSRIIWPPKKADLAAVRAAFGDSGSYWESRYATGGNSGSGSYNRLAEFKAEVIADLLASEKIATAIEFGVGDGAQLALTDYPAYIGVDVSDTILASCREKFADKPTYRFVNSRALTEADRAELTLSLDVIYHLVEDAVFDLYMKELFDRADRFVLVYASNRDEQPESVHVRHRKFTAWVEANRPQWTLAHHMPNRYPFDASDPDNTSFADFYLYKLG